MPSNAAMPSNLNVNFKNHAEGFELLYAKQIAGDNGLRFPLEDVYKLDWQRGVNADEYYNYMYRRFSSHIYDNAALEDGQKILILGCGGGSDEKNIKHLYPNTQLWSIDISYEMIARAIASKSPSQFAQAVAELLPFPDACFDRIISREVIEHVAKPDVMMQEVQRVLKPGGLAVITTENEESYALNNDKYESMMVIVTKCLPFLKKYRTRPGNYKDEAPSLAEFKHYCEDANLTLTQYFWDGALYKSLPVFQHLLGPLRLARLAHFVSGIENNARLAFMLCDQVKYIVKKPQSDEVVNEVAYTMPGSSEAVVKVDDGYCSQDGATTFRVNNGIANFIPVVDETETPQSTPTAAKQARPYYRLFAWCKTKARFIYRALLLVVAFFGLAFCRSNKKQVSKFVQSDFLKSIIVKNVS